MANFGMGMGWQDANPVNVGALQDSTYPTSLGGAAFTGGNMDYGAGMGMVNPTSSSPMGMMAPNQFSNPMAMGKPGQNPFRSGGGMGIPAMGNANLQRNMAKSKGGDGWTEDWGNGWQDANTNTGGSQSIWDMLFPQGGGQTPGQGQASLLPQGLLGLLSGLYGLGNAIGNPGGMNMGQVINLGREAGRLADPFMDQRAQYQTQLNQLMNDPTSIQNNPAYQFRMNQGVNAIDRAAAAKGMMGSGNRMYDLEQFGQGLASQEYDNQFNRLALLSGAQTGSPAAAGQDLMSGLQTGWSMQNARTTDIGSGLGALGTNNILGSLLGGLGGGLGSIIGGLGRGLGSLGSGIGNSLGNLFGGLSDQQVIDYLQSQGGALDSMWSDMAGSGNADLSSLMQQYPDAFTNLGSDSGSVITDLGNFFG